MRANDITIDVNEKAFAAPKDNLPKVLETKICEDRAIPPFTGTLSILLKKVLARIPAPTGATYIIRRENIELTTGYFAAGEKTIRVYPVADLVIPIATPGQFAQQQQLNQTGLLGVAGQFGQVGQLGQLGLVGQIGQIGLGGQIGQIGLGGQIGQIGLGGQIGQIGLGGQIGQIGLGGQIGQIGLGGQIGQIGLGGQIGQIGLGGQIGQIGLGGQIGQIGLGGQIGQIGQLQIGQVGQLGQLGQVGQLGQQGQLGQLAQIGQAGQFGLQNNGQQQLLITLITQVVGRPSDWRPAFDPLTGRPLNPLDTPEDPLAEEKNQLGYYAPALALVVKGSSRIHSSAQGPTIPGAAMGAEERKKRSTVRTDPTTGKPIDPKTIWQDALKKGLDEPGLIIACADYPGAERRMVARRRVPEGGPAAGHRG